MNKLSEFYSIKKQTNVIFKGINSNSRDVFFEKYLIWDTILGCLALFFVAFSFFIYCRNLILTLFIIFGMLLMIGTAFFFYSVCSLITGVIKFLDNIWNNVFSIH